MENAYQLVWVHADSMSEEDMFAREFADVVLGKLHAAGVSAGISEGAMRIIAAAIKTARLDQADTETVEELRAELECAQETAGELETDLTAAKERLTRLRAVLDEDE